MQLFVLNKWGQKKAKLLHGNLISEVVSGYLKYTFYFRAY